MSLKTTRQEEKEFIELIENKITNEVIKDRVVYLLKWYSKKATWDKRLYFFCACVSVIAPASITLINSCFKQYSNCLIPFISTFATIVAGILALTRWQEGWLRYRKTAEQIKSETSKFLLEMDHASHDTKNDIEKKFLDKLEDISSDENMEWAKGNKENQEDKNS